MGRWFLVRVLVLAQLTSSRVFELDAARWEARLSGCVAVVEFYANWCPQCLRFTKDFEAVAAEMSSVVFFGRVDATEEVELASRFKVRGYPEVLLFRNGSAAAAYDGPLEAESLAGWITGKTRPTIATLDNWTDARAFFGSGDNKDNKVRVLGRFSPEEKEETTTTAGNEDEETQEKEETSSPSSSSPSSSSKRRAWMSALEEAAILLDDESIAFALTTVGGSTAREGVYVKSPYTTSDDDMDVLEGDPPSAAEVARFVQARAAPAVTTYAASKSEFFRGGPAVHVLLFLDVDSPEAAEVDAVFEVTAQSRRDQARHVVVPASEQRLLEYFDVDPVDELPTVICVDLRQTRKATGPTRTYRYEPARFGELVLLGGGGDGILAFVDAVLARDATLLPFLRSEHTPGSGSGRRTSVAEDSAAGKVVTLTGATFQTVVQPRNDSTIDFFVTFYAPWCVHCKAFSSVFEAVADDFRHVDSIVLAKIDATKNDVDDATLNVDGFPTLVFFPAAAKAKGQKNNTTAERTHVLYEGPRDRSHLTAFLQQQATSAFDVLSASSSNKKKELASCADEEGGGAAAAAEGG